MSGSDSRTPLERCFERIVEMLNLQRIIRWLNRKFRNPPQYELLPDDYDIAGILERGDFIPYFQPIDDIYSYSDGSNPHLELHQEQENERSTLEQLERLAQNRLRFGTVSGRLSDYGDLLDEMRCNGMVISKTKQNLMDRKYPHVCFECKCKNPIQYKHAFGEACKKYNILDRRAFEYIKPVHQIILWKSAKETYVFEKQFRKWWRSKYVKFMCCSCYRKATQPNKQPTTYITHGEYIIESEPPEMDEEHDYTMRSSPVSMSYDGEIFTGMVVRDGLELSYDDNGELDSITARDDLPQSEYHEEP